ncbi:hypothetical protein [Polynucleobacter sp. HIN5]|nr:hypothetical protein [Polynucleobacter sp. HIN5]
MVAILPIQSWAVVDMSLQKEALQFGNTVIPPKMLIILATKR